MSSAMGPRNGIKMRNKESEVGVVELSIDVVYRLAKWQYTKIQA